MWFIESNQENDRGGEKKLKCLTLPGASTCYLQCYLQLQCF